MAGRLDEVMQNFLSDYLLAILENNPDKMIRVYSELDIIGANIDKRGLRRELKYFLDQYYGLPLKDLYIGEIMEAAMGMMVKYRIKMPPDFINKLTGEEFSEALKDLKMLLKLSV